MDGPDDELMGGGSSIISSKRRGSATGRQTTQTSSSSSATAAAAAVTPSPPPPLPPRRASSASSAGGIGIPPPANAFAHSSQYEQQPHRSSSSSSYYNDLPPHERVRAEAMAVLEKASTSGGSSDGKNDTMPSYELRQTKSGGLTTMTRQEEPFSFRRSTSTTGVEPRKLYNDDDDGAEQPYSFRRSSTGSSVSATDRTRRGRAPAALAGLDLKTAVPTTRSDSRQWSIADDDDHLGLNDEEDLVEVVNMENRIMGAGGGRSTNSPPRGNSSIHSAASSSSASSSNWSSRYSVNPYLSGGGGVGSPLELDKDQQRVAKSARNMLMSATPSSPTQPSTNIFGAGFTFRQTAPQTREEYNLKTVWSDHNDPLTSNGNSLDPPFYKSGISKARRRRRIWIFSILAVCVIAIIAGTSKSIKNRKAAPSSVIGGPAGSDGGTTFYVMADTPYDEDEGTKLTRDLQALPGDADFVFHLGNIQDAKTTLCSDYSYQEASTVLKTAPAPVFMLPGANDWNNCPDPDAAWEAWTTHFMKFERTFVPPFTVLRQSDEIENFSFLHDGVLFIGLHLVGGRVPDKDEWDELLALNVRWVEENFNNIFDDEDFRAVVLLGNARPSVQQHGFFNEIVNTIRSMGKPTLYIHASPEDGRSEFAEYRPFGEAGNLNAVQLEDGGRSPPLRVSVGSGSRPFALG